MAKGISKAAQKKKKEEDVDKAFAALTKGVSKMQEQLLNAEKNMTVQQYIGSSQDQITNIKAKDKAEAQQQAAGVLTMFGQLIKTLAPLEPQGGNDTTTTSNSNPAPSTTEPSTNPNIPTPSSGGKPENVVGPTGSLPAKRPLAPEDYQLRMGPGWTVNDGIFQHVPQTKRRKRDVPYPRYVNHSYRSMYGLSTLQISADAPISMCAMDTACDHIWKCLPKEVRQYVIVPPPNGPDLWSADEKANASMYEKMGLAVYSDSIGERYRFYENLKRKQWVVWPIWVEDRWGTDYVTICWKAKANPATPDVYDQLAKYAIIDPRRNQTAGPNGRHPVLHSRMSRIQAALMGFLIRGGYNVNSAQRQDMLCSPMPLGEATSGERCFATVKHLCNNICNWLYEGMTDDDTGFVNLPQWVHPYQQRVEMTGISAWVLMATFDYNARISVECIPPNSRTEVTANGSKRMVVPYDLAAQFEDPPISSYDYLLPPNGEYTDPLGPTSPVDSLDLFDPTDPFDAPELLDPPLGLTDPPPPYNTMKKNTSKSSSNYGVLSNLFKSFSAAI